MAPKLNVSMLILDDCEYRTDREIANVLNEYFVNIGLNLANAHPAVPSTVVFLGPPTSVALLPVSSNDILKYIDNMKPKKSSPNGISSLVLKRIGTSICVVSTDLINATFCTGI